MTVPDIGEDRILRIDDVCALIALSRQTIYRQCQRGEFPTPIRLTSRNIGWWLSDIIRWTQSRQGIDVPTGDDDIAP